MTLATMTMLRSRITRSVSRRRLGVLGLLALNAMHASPHVRAKKKQKNQRKATLCWDRQTLRVKKRKKQQLLKAGAVPGSCPCVPTTTDLQSAIAAADPESTLMLCAGTWSVASTVVIDKNLTIIGVRTEQTILDGGNAVQVLRTTEGTLVTLQDLTITRGNAGEGSGGGIAINRGTLTLRGVAVTANTANYGGGIANSVGTLILGNGSRVTGNTAERGGGIGGGLSTITLEAGSSVTGNTATAEGGGLVSGRSEVTLKPGSKVTANQPDNCFPDIGACI